MPKQISFLKGINKTIGKYEFRSFQGAQGVKIFYHRPGKNKLFFENYEQFMNINEKQRYSILGELNEDYKINGKYEFLLYYPDLNKYNWWRQNKLPYNEEERTGIHIADGYEGVYISMKENYWGGLVLQKIPYTRYCNYECSFVEGSVGHEFYFYAIGQRHNSETVPADNDQHWISDVYLWIRIIGINPSLLLSKIMKNEAINLPFLSVIIIKSS